MSAPRWKKLQNFCMRPKRHDYVTKVEKTKDFRQIYGLEARHHNPKVGGSNPSPATN
jgi:hypothetical protein